MENSDPRQAFVSRPAWPTLALTEWEATRATLHMWTQIVGKIRMVLTPHVNHWWEVPLYVTARGLTTSPIPYGTDVFEMEFDFHAHRLAIRRSGRETRMVELYARPVADFYREVTAVLELLGIVVRIWPMPVEVAEPIRFTDDVQHASYDPDAVSRFHQMLYQVDAVLKEFRGRFLGKASPVHFFWGSFDLAVTRFSGRRAPEKPGADAVTREAYSHECISAGFWPGGGTVKGPAFYSYSAPAASGYAACPVRPASAFYDPGLGEFLLLYEDVRTAESPRAVLLDFLQSTYEAGANTGKWDRAALEYSPL